MQKIAKGLLPAAVGFLAGVLFTAAIVLVYAGGLRGVRPLMRFGALLRVLERDYVGTYDLQEVTDGALTGAVDALGDQWSYYMDAETYAAYLDYASNQYQGIGVTVMKDAETGGFLIVTVTKDGPAQTAGIEQGDIILAVDGTDVTEGDTAFLKSLIQQDFGRTAAVTVLRGDGSTTVFDVSCEEIYSSPVQSMLLDGSVGYVAIDNFRKGAAEEAKEAIEALLEEGAECLLFDVRSNPGGQVAELTELLDYLLPEGDVFVRADKDGHEEVDTSDASCLELPTAVLVNDASYSAAEYFAAALREYGRAIVVGEPTTGKARSQITVALADGGAVHISKYTYLTPLRTDLYEAGGLIPDITAELTEEDRTLFDTGWLEPQDDAQIQAAIEALPAS